MLDLAYRLTRPLLFRMDPEDAHRKVLSLASSCPALMSFLAGSNPGLPQIETTFLGHTLPSPVGLAAGLDKDGEALLLWEKLGFGFVEVGTVTPRPQPGNPRPRIHRLVEDSALINSMGFPSAGAEAIRARLEEERSSGRWPDIPVGFNIGKNKDTPLEEAADDYGESAAQLTELADFFVINLSSPNTPGLRSLQAAEAMQRILHAVRERAGATPLLLKLSPDLEQGLLQQTVDTAIESGIDGIVATNTTLKRPTEGSQDVADGGFSGEPLHALSRACLQVVIDTAQGRVPVVGVGGINSADRARDILEIGCRVVELYSALIFEGPGLVRRINRGLSAES